MNYECGCRKPIIKCDRRGCRCYKCGGRLPKPGARRLDEQIRKAVERVKAMSTEEYHAMIREQARNWARAEASWPKPRYRMVNGVKVYESYGDYCAD